MEALGFSDGELARQACGGDDEAMAGLLERYHASLYAAAIGMLRDREDALDAVQDTCIAALTQLASLREPAAVGGWLHAVLRNTCRMRLRRSARGAQRERVGREVVVPSPEDVLDSHALRDWLWAAIHTLAPDDRATVMLRYFTRCCRYDAIAQVTGVPVGTVRSRLNRARSQLARSLATTLATSPLSYADLERTRRAEWEQFYTALHEAPVPGTYEHTYEPDVDVTDRIGRWRGVKDWSTHEREAIDVGVRARIVGIVAGRDLTVVEIDFVNPEAAPDHCPPRSTFVHRLHGGRSRRLDITYV